MDLEQEADSSDEEGGSVEVELDKAWRRVTSSKQAKDTAKKMYHSMPQWRRIVLSCCVAAAQDVSGSFYIGDSDEQEESGTDAFPTTKGSATADKTTLSQKSPSRNNESKPQKEGGDVIMESNKGAQDDSSCAKAPARIPRAVPQHWTLWISLSVARL